MRSGLIWGLLTLLLGLSLAACGDNTATNTVAPTTVTTTAAVATTLATTTTAATTTVAAITNATTTSAVTTSAATTLAATTSAATTLAATTRIATTVVATTSSTTVTTAATSTTVASATTTSVAVAPANKIKVLATTTQLGDFARNIGGNRVEVTQILRPDDDPHDYDPTATDSKNAAAAQIIFKNGVGLDDWMDKLISNSGTKAPVVDISQGIKLRAGKSDAEKAGDPHIWHSTNNTKIIVANMAKGLQSVDAAGKDYYDSQLQSYQKQLDDLKSQINSLFAPVAADKRKLVTNHDAFGYFADEFGITVVGEIIPNFSDAAQPTPQEVNQLIKNIKDNNVRAIFTETTINPKVAQQVAQAAGVKIFSNLYGDALGAAGTDGDTYLKMMLSNAKNMAAGFQQ